LYAFENVFQQNQASDENPYSLRVSIDTKAKVKIGNLSRGGKARTLEPKKADDHDTHWQAVLVPFGILNTHPQQLSIYMGQSVEAAVQWAANMTWKGIAPIVHRVETIYDKGIKVLPTELEPYHPFWQRSETLPKSDITIVPG
jgi:hypothetical protein